MLIAKHLLFDSEEKRWLTTKKNFIKYLGMWFQSKSFLQHSNSHSRHCTSCFDSATRIDYFNTNVLPIAPGRSNDGIVLRPQITYFFSHCISDSPNLSPYSFQARHRCFNALISKLNLVCCSSGNCWSLFKPVFVINLASTSGWWLTFYVFCISRFFPIYIHVWQNLRKHKQVTLHSNVATFLVIPSSFFSSQLKISSTPDKLQENYPCKRQLFISRM